MDGDGSTAARRRALAGEGTSGAVRREACHARAVARESYGHALLSGTGNTRRVEVDEKAVLREAAGRVARRGHPRDHAESGFSQVGPRRTVAVGGVANDLGCVLPFDEGRN